MAGSLIPGLGWLLVLFFLSSVFDRGNYIEASPSHWSFLYPDLTETTSIASKQYRASYHFQPLQHWINDPNGPMYYNGICHLFYQYIPYAAIWGNISGATEDLIQKSFPRVVSLDTNGRQLVQWPISDLESLRRKQTQLHDNVLKTGGLVEVRGLSVSKAKSEGYQFSRSSLRVEVEKSAYGAFVDIDIKKDGKISLRTLTDHSGVESFGAGGRTCITSRVYPTLLLRGDSHLYAFNNGTEAIKISNLTAWSMAESQIS